MFVQNISCTEIHQNGAKFRNKIKDNLDKKLLGYSLDWRTYKI